MTLALSDKLFVQLAPSDVSRKSLVEIAERLKRETDQIIDAKTFHLTVLHIGLLERLFRAISTETHISESAFLRNAETLARNLERLAGEFSETTFCLHSREFSAFGPKKSVLVLRFSTSTELESLHQKSLAILSDFLQVCGLENPDKFIKTNDSLQHSLTLRSHVSLARHFDGNMPEIETKSLDFSLMKIRYDH